jgi:hypothetical protein
VSAGSSDSTSSQPLPTDVQPPQFTTQPASRTVTVGQSATFMVSVSGQSPFNYQWFKNGSSILGATSSSYTTPPTTSLDNGAQFVVTVSNSGGAATSSPATLTVNPGTLLLSLNPTSLSFGDVTIGSSATKQATLTNTGTATVTLAGLSVSGAGFSASGVSTGQALAPGQSASIRVTFQPSVGGSANGAVTVASDAATVTLGLTGSGVQLVTHSVSLSWSPSASSVTGYQVYSSQVSGGPYTRLTTSAVPVTSYTDGSVQSGKTYYYVVTSIGSDAVESAYSEQATAVVQ